MTFLRRLRAAWLFSRQFPYAPEADGTWTTQDSLSAHGFFEGTAAGKKLVLLIRNYAVQSAMTAARTPKGEHAAGTAAGIAMTAAMIDSHYQYQAIDEEEPPNVVSM